MMDQEAEFLKILKSEVKKVRNIKTRVRPHSPCPLAPM